MNTTRLSTLAAFALLGAAFMATPSYAEGIDGTWLSADGGAKVRIAKCGGAICGRVVWLKEPTDSSTGKPKTDKHNPDDAKKSRPMIGLQVMSGMRPNGENKWKGQIYNADDGKTYSSNLTLLSADKARVEGCVLGVLCQGQTWTRTN